MRSYILFISIFVLTAVISIAQIPQKISYQGLLTTPSGAPVPDGIYSLRFDLFDAPINGFSLWNETQSIDSVLRGTFSVVLGSINPLTDSIFSKTLYVQVTVQSGPTIQGVNYPQIMSPRSELTSAPYSLAPWVPKDTNVYYTRGNVGIGTNAPVSKLSVAGSLSIWGNTPLPQSITRSLELTGGYSSPDAGRIFFGDGTGWKMHFSKRKYSVTTDLVTFTDDGYIGMDTKNPTHKLHIHSGDLRIDGMGDTSFIVHDSHYLCLTGLPGDYNHGYYLFRPGWGIGGLTHAIIRIQNASNTGVFTTAIELNSDGNSYFNGGPVGIGTTSPSYKLDVAGQVHATSFPTSSDIRFKKNIHTINNALEKVKSLNGVYFEWNDLHKNVLGRSNGIEGQQVGLIAQEVEKIVPEIVSTWEQEGIKDYRAVDYSRLTALLVEAIKELDIQNQEYRERLMELENLVKSLAATKDANNKSLGEIR